MMNSCKKHPEAGLVPGGTGCAVITGRHGDLFEVVDQSRCRKLYAVPSYEQRSRSGSRHGSSRAVRSPKT